MGIMKSDASPVTKQEKRADRIAALKAQQEALTQRLSQLEAKERADQRKLDTRRKIVVGGAVLAHLQKDPLFAQTLAMVLNATVGRPLDRAVIADLLQPQP
jgi:electron transfer flavoprotein alpha subunit